MSKKRFSVPALPYGYIVCAVSFAVLLLLASFICYLTSDPLKYVKVASYVLVLISCATGGASIRKKDGTFLQSIIFAVTVFALLLLLSLTGAGRTECYIIDTVCLPVSLISYFLPSLFHKKKRRRKRI